MFQNIVTKRENHIKMCVLLFAFTVKGLISFSLYFFLLSCWIDTNKHCVVTGFVLRTRGLRTGCGGEGAGLSIFVPVVNCVEIHLSFLFATGCSSTSTLCSLYRWCRENLCEESSQDRQGNIQLFFTFHDLCCYMYIVNEKSNIRDGREKSTRFQGELSMTEDVLPPASAKRGKNRTAITQCSWYPKRGKAQETSFSSKKETLS